MPVQPILYSPALESEAPDEAATHAELSETLLGIVRTTNEDHGHAYRSVHAKSHAMLEATFEVVEGLPAELAQGLFAKPGSYPAVLRVSTNAGDPLPDSISLPRGLAIKVIGVDGERLPGSEDDTTQDFVLAFLGNLKVLAATTDRGEWGKKAISAVFRTTEKVLEAVGGESVFLKTMGGYPQTHPLGESYYSQVPIRFGDYVAKVGVVPASANFQALTGQEITVGGRENALREEVLRVLAVEGGSFDLRVQLCRDLEANPVEDASVIWPEQDNPYLTVARIHVAAQPGWTEARAAIVDDSLAFAPWHGLAAHRPLGGIMRARKAPYAASAGLRSQLNRCPIHEPREAVNLPD